MPNLITVGQMGKLGSRVPPFSRSLKVIGTDKDRSVTSDLLLVLHTTFLVLVR